VRLNLYGTLYGNMQFPVLPAKRRDLPAKVQRVNQRTISQKGNKATPWKQEQ